MEDYSEELLPGSIDFHLHTLPDPYRVRSADAHEVALQARACGMKGFVLKSHAYPTAPLAQIIKKVVPGIEVIGGLALNREVGGINPYAVEVSARLGGKVLWMPTSSSIAARKRKGFSDGGITIFAENQGITAEVREVLSLVKEFDLVLCTGHLVQEEIIPLFAEARKIKIKKFVLTHPLKLAGTSIDLKILKALADQGAFMEHCFLATTLNSGNMDPAKIVAAIRFVGAQQCLLSTDFGRPDLPPPWEGMRDMIITMSRYGLTRKELNLLVKENPSQLLDI